MLNVPPQRSSLQDEDLMESFLQGDSCPGLRMLYLPTGCAPDGSPLTPWLASTFASIPCPFLSSGRRALCLSAAGWADGQMEEDSSCQSGALIHLHQ